MKLVNDLRVPEAGDPNDWAQHLEDLATDIGEHFSKFEMVAWLADRDMLAAQDGEISLVRGTGRFYMYDSVLGGWRPFDGDVANVLDRGAVGDAVELTGGSISSGDATLTVATAEFTADDVGKRITVKGAGAADAVLETTIAAYTSPTEVELADTAGTTVAAAVTIYGTDDTAAIQTTMDSSAAVYFPGRRRYMFTSVSPQAGAVVVGQGKRISTLHGRVLIGDGVDSTIRHIELHHLGVDAPSAYSVQINLSPDFKINQCYIRNGTSIRYSVRGAITYSRLGGNPWAIRAENYINGILIHGNIISGGQGGGAINLRGPVTVGAITDNIIESSLHGIWVSSESTIVTGDAGQSFALTITGNYIEQCSTPFYIARSFAVSGSVIEGNYVGNENTTVIAARSAVFSFWRLRDSRVAHNTMSLSPPTTLADGAMTAADATLTSASAPFAASDVGRHIIVAGAGVGGGPLETTIAAYTSPTEVELTTTAGTTVSGATVTYGEALFDINVTAALMDFTDNDVVKNRVQSGGPAVRTWAITGTGAGLTSFLRKMGGTNHIDLLKQVTVGGHVVPSGLSSVDVRTHTTRQFRADETVSQLAWLLAGATSLGGFIVGIEVIEAVGSLTGCRLRIGDTASSGRIVDIADLAAPVIPPAVTPLTYTNGSVDLGLTGSVWGPGSTHNTITVTAGAGTGTFRLRLRYRAS